MRKYELEVGTKNGEVIVNHPALDVDANGVGHIVFSPAQARGLAQSLLRQATIAEESGAASVIIRPTPPPILTTELFPYIGLDELGTGTYGLKQGITAMGTIPLVSVRRSRMEELFNQMEAQAANYGKRIRLCRYVFAETLRATSSGEDVPVKTRI